MRRPELVARLSRSPRPLVRDAALDLAAADVCFTLARNAARRGDAGAARGFEADAWLLFDMAALTVARVLAAVAPRSVRTWH